VLARSGGKLVLETGTLRREWKRAKELAWGPKGKKSGMGGVGGEDGGAVCGVRGGDKTRGWQLRWG